MSVSSDLVDLYPRRQKEEGRQEMTSEPLTDRRFCLTFARALYPGEVGLEDVLEAAAVFHAWLSGRLDIGLSRAPAASADGEPLPVQAG